jgi:hypothetical protein
VADWALPAATTVRQGAYRPGGRRSHFVPIRAGGVYVLVNESPALPGLSEGGRYRDRTSDLLLVRRWQAVTQTHRGHTRAHSSRDYGSAVEQQRAAWVWATGHFPDTPDTRSTGAGADSDDRQRVADREDAEAAGRALPGGRVEDHAGAVGCDFFDQARQRQCLRTPGGRFPSPCGRVLEGRLASPYALDVTKFAVVIGGVIGFVLGFLLTFEVGDHIDWVSRQSDYIGNAVAVAVGVVGWVVGSHAVGRLTGRQSSTRRT